MEIIRGLHNVKPRHKGAVLTIGNFDGVHRGHRMLLERLEQKSRELGARSMLLTFEPQPREYFAGASVPARLTRFREKMTLLRETSLDQVLLLPFNEQTAATPARWVIDELLVRRLEVAYMLVGDDARFGHRAEGDFEMLKRAGAEHGFGVSHMGTLELGAERVSSTRIRQALAEGDLRLAERLLGHRYFIMGNVVYGRQLGRQLGVPTANVRLQRYRAALEGVFAVTVTGLGETRQGVANIGVRPTVDGKEPLLEVHLFDFEQNIYGRLLTVHFHHKIRDEQAFDGLDVLQAQIEKDMRSARRWFADNAGALNAEAVGA